MMVVRSRERHVLAITPSKTTFYTPIRVRDLKDVFAEMSHGSNLFVMAEHQTERCQGSAFLGLFLVGAASRRHPAQCLGTRHLRTSAGHVHLEPLLTGHGCHHINCAKSYMPALNTTLIYVSRLEQWFCTCLPPHLSPWLPSTRPLHHSEY